MGLSNVSASGFPPDCKYRAINQLVDDAIPIHRMPRLVPQNCRFVRFPTERDALDVKIKFYNENDY